MARLAAVLSLLVFSRAELVQKQFQTRAAALSTANSVIVLQQQHTAVMQSASLVCVQHTLGILALPTKLSLRINTKQ
jgi:hypothetical protein